MKHIYLTILSCILILNFNNANAQSAFARYKVQYGPTAVGGFLPVHLNIVYNVWVDSNFIEIVGIEDSFSAEIPTNFSELKKHPQNEHIIIDRKSQIGLFVNEGKYANIEPISPVKTERNQKCSTMFINDSATITVCNNISQLVSPGVLINNKNTGGVKSIRTSKTSIELIGTPSTSKRKLDYQQKFANIKKSKVIDSFSFFK